VPHCGDDSYGGACAFPFGRVPLHLHGRSLTFPHPRTGGGAPANPQVILVGHLGKDPEVRYAQDGSKIVNFSLATSEYWKDKATGERKERTEWHRVVIVNERLADTAQNFL